MIVDLWGDGREGDVHHVGWHLVAGSGHGPYVPALPAVIVARRLARGGAIPGARACFGLFAPEDFMAEARGLDIHTGTWRGPLV